jgi:hypothetical protein
MQLRLPRALRALFLVASLWVLGAPSLTGVSPALTEHVVLSSATDWVSYTAPAWARQCLVTNEGSGAAYVSHPSDTGAFSAVTDEYLLLPAGSARNLDLSAGQSSAPTTHLVIGIASATASLPLSFHCSAAAP